jgi:prepilin peptidase CpaA
MYGGLDGLKLAGGGFALGFIAMAIPYFMGVMGAGDVKLMAGVGAWLGTTTTLTAFLFTCLAGGIYALIVLLLNKKYLKTILTNIANAFMVFMATKKFNFTPASTEQALPRLCYGIAIAAGTGVAMVLHAMQTGSICGSY